MIKERYPTSQTKKQTTNNSLWGEELKFNVQTPRRGRLIRFSDLHFWLEKFNWSNTLSLVTNKLKLHHQLRCKLYFSIKNEKYLQTISSLIREAAGFNHFCSISNHLQQKYWGGILAVRLNKKVSPILESNG